MPEQTQGPEQEQSAFNARADNAAIALKGDLSQELTQLTGREVVLPPSPVAVGPDGQPAGPLPPPGSYARTSLEEQKAESAHRAQHVAYQQAQVNQPDPNQQAAGQPPPQEPPEVSQRAQERISSLVNQLREKDVTQSTMLQQQQDLEQRLQARDQQLEARDKQMQTFMQEHMDELDPEVRAQVMSEARTSEAIAQSEARILGQVAPQLEALQVRNQQLEKQHLSDVHSGYDPMVHDQLIDVFRQGNPNCSVEQAFRAIATPDELSTGGGGRVNVVPPTLPPGNGTQQPRYLPASNSEKDPVAQMRDDAARAAQLARSADPEDHKRSQLLFAQNIADRLGGTIPGR